MVILSSLMKDILDTRLAHVKLSFHVYCNNDIFIDVTSIRRMLLSLWECVFKSYSSSAKKCATVLKLNTPASGVTGPTACASGVHRDQRLHRQSSETSKTLNSTRSWRRQGIALKVTPHHEPTSCHIRTSYCYILHNSRFP